MIFNKNLLDVQASASIQLMKRAKELQGKYGEKIIDLAGGEPDFSTPAIICNEAIYALNQGYTHYTVGTGLPELRRRIADKLHRENGCSYNESDIIVTPGAKFAVYLSLMSLINPGDEVIIFQPGWVSYSPIIKSLGAKVNEIKLCAAEGYKFSLDLLEQAYTSKTRVMIINYPTNPTGKILKADEAEILREFLRRHNDLILISDEIYEKIVFDDLKNISMAAYSDVADRVITINGFSKAYAMTGWRLGYAAANSVVISEMYKIYQHMMTCVSGFIMKAGIKALTTCDDEVEKMRLTYEKRRNDFINGLNNISGVQCEFPEGTFYAWVKFTDTGKESSKFAEYLLNNARVIGVPGTAYGETDDVFMRFSFANSERRLENAVENIRKLMEG